MARYVDADELLKNLKKQYGEELGWQCTVNMSDVGMMIEDAPTADVVEVVRCKDCKHCERGICYYPKVRYVSHDKNHFCSYGKRKGGVE